MRNLDHMRFEYLHQEWVEGKFEVFDDVRLNETNSQLLVHRKSFFPPQQGLDKPTTFTLKEAWRQLDEKEAELWHKLKEKRSDQEHLKKEFLNRLNCDTYSDIEFELGLLAHWQAGDAGKVRELGENPHEEYYKRHLMRNALNQCKVEIENLLGQLGYDAEEELRFTRRKSFNTRESLLDELESKEKEARENHVRDIRIRRARLASGRDSNRQLGEPPMIGASDLGLAQWRSDFAEPERLNLESELKREREETNRLISHTLRLLPENFQEQIENAAQEFSEELCEFYNSFVASVESLTQERLKELLRDDGKYNEFFIQKLSANKLQEFKESGYKTLRNRWHSQLSESAKHVLKILDGEYGELFQLTNEELVQAGYLSKDKFQKRERDEWLPKMREMKEKCEAEKLARFSKMVSGNDEVHRRGDEQGLLEAANIFRKNGRVFEIRFKGGEKALVPERLGLAHILILLRSPRQEVPVDNFLNQASTNMEGWQAEEQGLSIRSQFDADANSDDKAKVDMEEKLKRISEVELPALRKNKEEFEGQGNAIEAKECDDEIRAKEKEIRDISQRLERDAYPEQEVTAKKKQNAVRNAIRDSLTELKREAKTQAFAEHFERCYRGGKTFCYSPDEEIEWLTV